MTCHDFQIGQHLSKNLAICWVKAGIHRRQVKVTVRLKLFTENMNSYSQ
jgi:hypothetical protein